MAQRKIDLHKDQALHVGNGYGGIKSVPPLLKAYQVGGRDRVRWVMDIMTGAYPLTAGLTTGQNALNGALLAAVETLLRNNPHTDSTRLIITIKNLGTPGEIQAKAKAQSGASQLSKIVKLLARQYNAKANPFGVLVGRKLSAGTPAKVVKEDHEPYPWEKGEGSIEFRQVSIESLIYPDFQRTPAERRRTLESYGKWNKHRAQVIDVVEDEKGLLWVIDGGGRAWMALQQFGPEHKLNALIHQGVGNHEAMYALFGELNAARAAVTLINLFNGAVAVKHTTEQAIHETLQEFVIPAVLPSADDMTTLSSLQTE